jgi:Flp pilus assembly protein protease CpaA
MFTDLLWLIAIVVGGIAAWLDRKYRKVPNGLWISGLAVATPFLLMEAWRNPVSAGIRLGCATLFAGFLWVLWLGQAFGGADAKGFALFGLLLSPVEYFSPWQSRFFPALDVLVTALLLSEILRRVLRERKMPLFLVSQWPLLLVYAVGGLVWWPLVSLLRLFVH